MEENDKYKCNQNEFDKYWQTYGIPISELVYKNYFLTDFYSKYIDEIENEVSSNSKTINVENIILDLYEHLSNDTSDDMTKTVEADSFDKSAKDAEVYNVWHTFSWTYYRIFQQMYINFEGRIKADDIMTESTDAEAALHDLIQHIKMADIGDIRGKRRKRKKANKKKHNKLGFVKKTKSGLNESLNESTDDLSAQKENIVEKANKNPVFEELTDKGLGKYWHKRYKLFSKYDEGVKIDDEGWYSVTPEAIALHQAKRCACGLIVDPFCGCGGNAIQFGSTCDFVITGDVDEKRLLMAKNNSKIYGVNNKIDFILIDAVSLLSCIRCDVVFMSPPWGGPSYILNDSFHIDHHLDPPLFTLFNSINTKCHSVAIFLPRNIAIKPMKKYAKRHFGGKMEVETNFEGKHIVAKTVYFGDVINQDS